MKHEPAKCALVSSMLRSILPIALKYTQAALEFLWHSVQSVVIQLRLRLIEADRTEATIHPISIMHFMHLLFLLCCRCLNNFSPAWTKRLLPLPLLLVLFTIRFRILLKRRISNTQNFLSSILFSCHTGLPSSFIHHRKCFYHFKRI